MLGLVGGHNDGLALIKDLIFQRRFVLVTVGVTAALSVTLIFVSSILPLAYS